MENKVRAKNFIITIARGFGSGGKYIGKALSQELSIPCYDSQILSMASDESGISKRLFFQADEKLKGINLVKRLVATPNTDHIVAPTEKGFVSDDNLFSFQVKIIKQLAKTQSCIIIGKCANHILKEHDNVISVYVEAPRKNCVESITSLLGVSEAEAHKMIAQTDKYRADYYKYYTGGDYWTNPVSYDITLNSARIGRDNCARLIIACANIKLGYDITRA